MITVDGSVGLPAMATTDANWTGMTISVRSVQLDCLLTGGSAKIVVSDLEQVTDVGCIYQANIVYRLYAAGRTKLWFKRTAADVTLNVTEHQHK